jgi:hypothetical protein
MRPIKWKSKALSPWLKQPSREADYLPESCAKAKKYGSMYPFPSVLQTILPLFNLLIISLVLIYRQTHSRIRTLFWGRLKQLVP